jgi:hypothetical protein
MIVRVREVQNEVAKNALATADNTTGTKTPLLRNMVSRSAAMLASTPIPTTTKKTRPRREIRQVRPGLDAP